MKGAHEILQISVSLDVVKFWARFYREPEEGKKCVA